MARTRQEGLTAREMALMQGLWQRGETTVEMIQVDLLDRLEGSTIRTLLRIMEDKDYVKCSKHKISLPHLLVPDIQPLIRFKNRLDQIPNCPAEIATASPRHPDLATKCHPIHIHHLQHPSV